MSIEQYLTRPNYKIKKLFKPQKFKSAHQLCNERFWIYKILETKFIVFDLWCEVEQIYLLLLSRTAIISFLIWKIMFNLSVHIFNVMLNINKMHFKLYEKNLEWCLASLSSFELGLFNFSNLWWWLSKWIFQFENFNLFYLFRVSH